MARIYGPLKRINLKCGGYLDSIYLKKAVGSRRGSIPVEGLRKLQKKKVLRRLSELESMLSRLPLGSGYSVTRQTTSWQPRRVTV